MSNIQAGRYKRFNKKFDIQNFVDLSMTVFDNDLLRVLEFLRAIDGNQHERLEICFILRNTCAHPGEATVSQENVLSFFSDLDTFVFGNPKFNGQATSAQQMIGGKPARVQAHPKLQSTQRIRATRQFREQWFYFKTCFLCLEIANKMADK
jgi:hypothetical protein